MKRFQHNILKLVVLAIFFSSQNFALQATTLSQSTTVQTSAKVDQWLKQSGYKYTKAAETVWIIKSKGNALSEFETFVAVNENVVVIGVVMAKQKDLKMSEDVLFKLLKLNHDNDFVKIGIDGDNDLFVRLERKVRTLDLEELKSCYAEVVAASDNVYTQIKPFLITGK